MKTMLNFLKQLFIERLLSGAKPYVAFHPELGVPIGIFNYNFELSTLFFC